MKHLVGWTLTLGLVVSVVPVWAGEVKVSFSNGLVSVVAIDASPREILGEWARLGQVRVTNLDRLAGTPVTLQLTDVPETRALETILRGTAGYIAAPRRESNSTISRYDRLLLMPGIAPPLAVATPSPQPSNGVMGRGRPGQPPYGTPGYGGTGSPGDTPGFAARWGTSGTSFGPNRPAAQPPGQQSFMFAQPYVNGATQQQAAPPPTSSQVPGMPVGRTGQWNGAARPGEATALPTSSSKPGGPIKIPE